MIDIGNNQFLSDPTSAHYCHGLVIYYSVFVSGTFALVFGNICYCYCYCSNRAAGPYNNNKRSKYVDKITSTQYERIT